MSEGLDNIISSYKLNFTDNDGNPTGEIITELDVNIIKASDYFRSAIDNEPDNDILYLARSRASPEEFRHFYRAMELIYQYPNFQENIEREKILNLHAPSVYHCLIDTCTENKHVKKRDRRGNPPEVAELFADWFDRIIYSHLDEKEILYQREREEREKPPPKARNYDEKDYTPIDMTEEDKHNAELEFGNMIRFITLGDFLANEKLIKIMVRFFSVVHGYYDSVRYDYIIRRDYGIDLEEKLIEHRRGR